MSWVCFFLSETIVVRCDCKDITSNKTLLLLPMKQLPGDKFIYQNLICLFYNKVKVKGTESCWVIICKPMCNQNYNVTFLKDTPHGGGEYLNQLKERNMTKCYLFDWIKFINFMLIVFEKKFQRNIMIDV